MSRPTIGLLADILESAVLATRYAGGLDPKTLAAAELPRDAALFRLAIVCEAASQLPADVRALAPDIPWRKIRNMRNRIIHSYWQIDFVTVADTITHDLETLKAATQRLIDLVD